MKNLLTSVACIMILLAFVLQFTQNQVLHNRLTAIDQAGNNFKEIIKQEGCITAENEKQLKKEICRILDCPEEDIRIKGGRERVFRGGLIHYSIEVPVKEIISVPLFWGIREDENQISYKIHRYTTSEYIGRS